MSPSSPDPSRPGQLHARLTVPHLPCPPRLPRPACVHPSPSPPLSLTTILHQACELAISSPPKQGAAVTVSAGGELVFNLAPRDCFGNNASAAADAVPAAFTWRLLRLKAAPRQVEPDPEPERSDRGKSEKDAAATAEAELAARPPPPVVVERLFTDLEQTSPPLEEAGDFELCVTHTPPGGGEPSLVRSICVVVAAAEISPTHCTLAGSALHPCKGDGFSSGEREAMFICRDRFGNRVHRTGLKPPELSVTFKNQHPDGGAETRAEFHEEVSIDTCTSTNTHTHTRAHAHLHTHAQTHIYIHTHTRTSTYKRRVTACTA